MRISTAVLLCIIIIGAKAQIKEERSQYTIRKINEPIEINGEISETAWQIATEVNLDFETFPGENSSAPFKTQCFLSYDEDNLYLACKAFDDDPSSIRGFITDRDDVQQHDRISLLIDPFNDSRRAFDFTISALGVQSDGIFDQQTGETDNSWNTIWNSTGKLTENGFEIEASIPFKSLRFPATDDIQTWGFYLMRKQPRSNEVEVRSMKLNRNNNCELCQANQITGFTGIKPGVNLQLTPTLTFAKTDERTDFPNGEINKGNIKVDPGLDLRWNVTTDITLNATINPDFSQVEADVAQLAINNRFALFFPERRPFFLEGADYFNTPIQAVFTRTIADPIFGSKITAKVGGNTMGLLVAKDEVNNLLIPGNQGSDTEVVDDNVNVVIARYRRDVGKNSNFGLLFTDREASNYFNRLGGIDGFIRLSRVLTTRLQYLYSSTSYNDTIATNFDQQIGTFNGQGIQSELILDSKDWAGRIQYRLRDRDFRADAGFVSQVDVSNINGWISRRFWGNQDNWYTRVNLSSGFWHSTNLDGRLNDQGLWMAIFYSGPMQSNFWINPSIQREFYDGTIYDKWTLWSRIELQPSGNLWVRQTSRYGKSIDYSNGRSANDLTLVPNLTIRLGRHFDFRFSHTFRKLFTHDFRIFTANLSQFRAVYNFNTRTLFRAIVQYNQTNKNPSAYDDEVDIISKGLSTQFLFSYKVNPQTVFFIGYSDGSSGMINENNSETPITLENRTFFMKLSYAWRP